jgi:hypothetical protein
MLANENKVSAVSTTTSSSIVMKWEKSNKKLGEDAKNTASDNDNDSRATAVPPPQSSINKGKATFDDFSDEGQARYLKETNELYAATRTVLHPLFEAIRHITEEESAAAYFSLDRAMGVRTLHDDKRERSVEEIAEEKAANRFACEELGWRKVASDAKRLTGIGTFTTIR